MQTRSNTVLATPSEHSPHPAGMIHAFESTKPPSALPKQGNSLGRDIFCLFGLVFDRVTLAQTEQRIGVAIDHHERLNLATPNLNIVRLSQSEPALRDYLLAADMSLMDGMPLVWIARLLGLKPPERVAGSDVFEALGKAKSRKTNAFFFGGSEEDAERLKTTFANIARPQTLQGIHFGGAFAPGFGSVEEMSGTQTLAQINAAKPDFLVVAVSARKGLAWIGRNEHFLNAPVIANLGATIHFATDAIKRAPLRWRKIGLEWLWRIRQEPALFSRYAKDFGMLARLLATRIVPLLATQPLLRMLATRKSRIRILPNATTKRSEIRLVGCVTETGLWPLREALGLASATQRHVVVDVARAQYLDPFALGVILLTYGQMRRNGGSLSVTGAPWRIRLLFKLQGCGFLLKTGHSVAAQPALIVPSLENQSMRAPR
jgi:N-acetylglucosaminyldiphosphoundecaprenol N-acetyl-beta-D-mannosaminyltransferase